MDSKNLEKDYINPNLFEYTYSNNKNGWEPFFDSCSFSIKNISEYLIKEAENNVIYPRIKDVYKIFNIIKPEDIKVIIIGQDPYINKNQAMGISFSVPKGTSIPPSLSNIFKEVENCGYKVNYKNGDLTSWCEQGVFMINTALTVKAGKSNSHSDLWLESFTPKLMKWLNEKCNNCVIVMWGKYAQQFDKYFSTKHVKLKSPHPSPYSANHGFFGCKHFLKINEQLKKFNKKEIDWNL